MPISAGLLLVTALVAPGPQAAAPPGTPAVAAQQPQPQGESGAPAPSSTTRPHEVGLGGFGGAGGGPSFRYFFSDRVGVDMTAGWYRSPNTGSSSRGTTFQASPSMVLMLNKSHQLADLDVRPYVGVGLIYLHNTTPIQTAGAVGTSQGGVGSQVYGGVELSFASAPSIAISAEVIYHRLPVQTFNANLTRGTDFYLLFHYYLR
jgi:hypothetical protein